MGTVTAKQRTIDICKELARLAHENTDWGAPLRFAAFVIATKYRIPKKDRLWEGTHRKIQRPRKKRSSSG